MSTSIVVHELIFTADTEKTFLTRIVTLIAGRCFLPRGGLADRIVPSGTQVWRADVTLMPVDIIAAKRDGKELEERDIRRMVLGYTAGDIPDYQMAAFLMAVCIRGFSFEETCAMTRAMIASGKTLDWSDVPGVKVDKHSTGGVGDKTTLVVVPILAACGLKVPKMSGRGLGFTGGTVDKLESIPGLTTDLGAERIRVQIRDVGAVIAGQSAEVVPADKMIYALRDVTATVDSIPLIASSVMSKKIACGADVILLDVKVGRGAFMKDIESARELARTMTVIGERLGHRTAAVLTDMDQPLGNCVGNALEVREAVETMRDRGPSDFCALCVELSGLLLYISEQTATIENARIRAAEALKTGAALSKFEELVAAQGGNTGFLHGTSMLPTAPHVRPVTCVQHGFVAGIDAEGIGKAACALGAGRLRKEDPIDPSAGILLLRKTGDAVEPGAKLAEVHGSSPGIVEQTASALMDCFEIRKTCPEPKPLVRERFLPCE